MSHPACLLRLHKHTDASKDGVGEILVCHRRSRMDVHVRAEGWSRWTGEHDITVADLNQLVSAVDDDELLFRLSMIHQRKRRELT